MADQALHYQALDEGVKSTFECIDKDLEALDQRVNRRRADVDEVEEKLTVAQGKIEVLEERVANGRRAYEELLARVEAMEGKLCRCGDNKENEVPDSSPVLGSPIVLASDSEGSGSSETGSYHSTNALVPAESSTVVDSPVTSPPQENTTALPVRPPLIDHAGLHALWTVVRGQRASRGRRYSYHPYARLCCKTDGDIVLDDSGSGESSSGMGGSRRGESPVC